jgi:hypothetical protein
MSETLGRSGSAIVEQSPCPPRAFGGVSCMWGNEDRALIGKFIGEGRIPLRSEPLSHADMLTVQVSVSEPEQGVVCNVIRSAFNRCSGFREAALK